MSDQLFDIIFRGDIVLGHNIQDVKQRLGQLFKIDATKVDGLFTGGAVPLKRNVDQATAEKYKAVLAKAGAQAQIRAAGAESPKPKLRPKPVAAITKQAKANPFSGQSKPQKKLTLKERLALQAAQAAEGEKLSQQSTPGNQPEPAQNSPEDDSGFSLAPVGSLLATAGKAKQPKPVDIDVSTITLKPIGGDLLDAKEKAPAPIPRVQAADYAIADVGADLLSLAERAPVAKAQMVVSDYAIAEVGADLLEASYKPALPEVEVPIRNLSLAPTGSDMGQQKKDPPPPPPDTSSLRLA